MKTIENSKHHYVPQLLLRNFGVEGRPTLYAFDKSNSKEFKVAVENAACERGFYTYSTEDNEGCAEGFLGQLETDVGAILATIVADRRIPALNEWQRLTIAKFAAAQLLRSVSARSMVIQMGEVIRRLADVEGTPEFKAWVGNPDPEVDKQITIQYLEEQVETYHHHLLDKDWVLFTAGENEPLLIGDNPLVRTNNLNKSALFGTQGIASRGVEIYLPISPTLLIGFMCPTIAELNRSGVLLLGREAPDFAFEYLFALEDGRSVALEKPNVTHFNSLQVGLAERFVYSGSPDFSIAKQMLADDSSFRKGPKLRTNLPY